MGTREDILRRVRLGLGATPATDFDAYLAAKAEGPRPEVGANLVEAFVRKAEAMASSISVVDRAEDVPAAVRAYLDQRALPRSGCRWPQLASFDWAAAGIETAARAAVDADKIGLTGAFCGIAETGTLMLLSGPDTPTSVSLLPETHIAVLPVSRIVAGMEDAWKLMRAECGEPPRSVSFVSGPSRTGDIEMEIVMGIHGPYRVHIVLYGS